MTGVTISWDAIAMKLDFIRSISPSLWISLRCDARSLLYFAAAGACENTGVLLFLIALGLGEVSVVTPLAGAAPLFVLLLAFVFPSAAGKLSGRVVVGAVLIVLRVFLLTGWR